MVMKYLKNKNVLVTGGGGGIGWGICLECARQGARVVVTDVNDQLGNETLGDILEISAGHIYQHLDLRKPEAFSNVLRKIYNQVGPIHVLFNNAGINSPCTGLDITLEQWDEVMDVNLRGHVFLTKLVVNKMVNEGIHGSVIFTSSVHQDVPSTPHYSASKAALKGLIPALAADFGPYGIRVNGIAPGGIHIQERTENPQDANDEPTVLLGGKNGIPRDIGRMGVVLASDYWSRHVTGEIVTVSGGQYLRPISR
jgi:NAD(P)-dependent dehydrogenase (short-subunit alcohol dehydrogenase family)